MPYAQHMVFPEPEGNDVTIWRYMDLTKLLATLDSGTLFFTRSDFFEDAFEGSHTKATVAQRRAVMAQFGFDAERADRMGGLARACRRWTAINCWHMNVHESAAMWKLYLRTNEGAAIRSSFQRLKASVANVQENVFIGPVRYIDYASEIISETNLLYPFVHKRKSFEHERELRAIIIRFPNAGSSGLALEADKAPIPEPGVAISVELAELVEAIYVPPGAAPWFSDLVRSLLKKLGHDFEVRQSSLSDGPVY